MTRADRMRALAALAGRRSRGSLPRRRFLRDCARLGIGFSTTALLSMAGLRPYPRLIGTAAAQTAGDAGVQGGAQDWLREVARPFRGRKIRMVTEATPPSLVLQRLARAEFTPATGIEVEIEPLPLERVLQRIALDVPNQVARYDLYYLDQSWIARFAEDTIDPRARWPEGSELAMPGYDWDDFQPSLMQGISMYRGKLVGVPFDIPIFIMFYRQDIFDELGLDAPSDMTSYLSAIETIQAAKAPLVYGTTGECKAGHYSLNCEWTAWLWSHGGSIFAADGTFSGGDEDGLRGLEYFLRLRRSMPPDVEDWTWDGQTQSLLLGLAAVTLTWAEIFPAVDDPSQSLVAGRMTPAVPPKPAKLRPPADCGYGEIPNIGHQGGSALSLARKSENPDAAWIFLQWATSADVQARASLLGGGASPTRRSVFDDPRILQAASVGAGTTRHFAAVRKTIETRMGSEPDLPVWPDISNGVIPRELGRLLLAERKDPEATMARIKAEADALTMPYRP